MSSMARPWVASCSAVRASFRSTISMTSSRESSWKTMTSSIRFKNSGRKWAFKASLTLAFIRS